MHAPAHLLAVLILAAAGSAVAQEKHLIDPTPPGSLNPEPLPPLQNPDAPSTPAKELFARKSTPFPGSPRSIGGYFDGCLAGAVPLPITGPTWQVMRLSRNRNWGNPQLVRFIERFAQNAKKVGWNGLLVGDMSQPRGGPMLSDHASHQVGLDVDIWFRPMPDQYKAARSASLARPPMWSRPICLTSIRKCGPIGIPRSSAPPRRTRRSPAS
jgi:penicillin-insensitive murein endopeptidase